MTLWVPTPDKVKAAFTAQATPSNTAQRTFKVEASSFNHILTEITSQNTAIDDALDSSDVQLPTQESSSLSVLSNTSQKGASYYLYKKNDKTYVVTSEKTFLHKNYDESASGSHIIEYILIATHLAASNSIGSTSDLKLVHKAIPPLVFKDMYIAVYKNERSGLFAIYTAPTDIFTDGGPKVVAANPSGGHQTPNPSGGHQTPNPSGGHQTPNPSGGHQTPNPAGGHQTPNPSGGHQTPNPASGAPPTVSPTTLATTPCAGPYARAINTYNADVLRAPIIGKPIACSTAETEAKTKLTVTITPSVPIALGSVMFKDVPMEKKDDGWFGFMMIAEPAVSSSQWIQLEVKEQKLSYTACLGQCDTVSPKYEQKKDLEVKHDKDKKYKFEGGTVEYTEENPFHKGDLTLILGLGLGIGIPVLLIFIFALAYAFSPKAQALVQSKLSYVSERLPNLRPGRYLTESSTPLIDF
jgi:hypothetical protein